MGVLTYSALNKISKILTDQLSDADGSKIISKEVTIDYLDIAGNSFEISLGELPAGCRLINSHVDVDTIFSDGSVSPRMSVGIKTIEFDEIDFSVQNPHHKIFEDFQLNQSGVTAAQGTLPSDPTLSQNLNMYQNELTVQFDSRGSWSAGGDLNVAAYRNKGAGYSASGLSFGGSITGASGDATEEYNGSSWSISGSLNTPRKYHNGCGIQDAGLCAGHNQLSEEYNGATWANAGSQNGHLYYQIATGSQDAALAAGGEYSNVHTNTTEEYDGATWTLVNDLLSNRSLAGGAGTQTASIIFGGKYEDGDLNNQSCEEYNGTIWATANSLNYTTYIPNDFGLQSAALCSNGTGAEEYDGVVWFVTNAQSSYKAYTGSCGTISGGLVFGGSGAAGATEEYSQNSLMDLEQGSLSLYVTYSYQ